MGKTKRQIQYGLAIILGMVLFAAAAYGARQHHMQGWEVRLFDAIFHWSNGLRWFFLVLTQFGSAASVLGAVLVSYLSGYRQLSWRLLLTGYSAYILVTLAKELVNRPRPFVLLSGIHERELMVSGNGFPSGHTAVATALALTLAPHLPKHWRWLPLAWIVGVGLSRIYLGVHAPLDIVGGFGIGLSVTATLHFFVNTDKKLRKSPLKR